MNGAGRQSLRARHPLYCFSGCSQGPLGSPRGLQWPGCHGSHTPACTDALTQTHGAPTPPQTQMWHARTPTQGDTQRTCQYTRPPTIDTQSSPPLDPPDTETAGMHRRTHTALPPLHRPTQTPGNSMQGGGKFNSGGALGGLSPCAPPQHPLGPAFGPCQVY